MEVQEEKKRLEFVKVFSINRHFSAVHYIHIAHRPPTIPRFIDISRALYYHLHIHATSHSHHSNLKAASMKDHSDFQTLSI